MSSSEAPGRPNEMQLSGPGYCMPESSFLNMPWSNHLHPCTHIGTCLMGGAWPAGKPYLRAAGQLGSGVCWAVGQEPELATFLVVCQSRVGPSVPVFQLIAQTATHAY